MEKEKRPASLPAWLTEDIFADILKSEYSNFSKITQIQPNFAVSDGENYMTTLLRVTIEFDLKDNSHHETSYIVKLPLESEHMRAKVEEWNSFRKELFVYETLLPAFEELFRKAGKQVKFGAKFHNVQSSKCANESIVILEDLKNRRFRNVKRQEGLDLQHTKHILEKLAEFHAVSAVYSERHGPYPEMFLRCLCSKKDEFGDFRAKQCEEFIKSLRLSNLEHLADVVRKWRQATPDQFQAVSEIDPEGFNCLNHGDCWINNLMFKHDSKGHLEDFLFVDFQAPTYGSPVQDLYYFLLSSPKLEIKIKYFDSFVAFYQEKLVENLKLLHYTKAIPSLRDLHIALLKQPAWALTVVLNTLGLLLLDSTQEASMENYFAGNSLQRRTYENPRFVENMKVILPWMLNRGMLE